MKFTCNPDGRCFYTLDELSYNDFDKSGRIGLWKLSKLLEGSRTQRCTHGPEAPWQSNYLNFVRSQTYEICPAFYSLPSQNLSVKVISCLSHIGKTSYCVDEELLDLVTHETLARSTLHAVVVSKATRRPILPDTTLVDCVIRPQGAKRPLPDPKFPERPVKCFTHRRTVMPSDTDQQDHLNQAGYLRFSVDCVSMAVISGALSAFHEDIIYSDAKRVWIRYVSEAEAGEEVTISCWEDADNGRMVWVELTKESKVMGHCQLEFYRDSKKQGASVPQAKL